MANMKDFNPKAVLVVRKAGGLSLNGRRYLQGEAISDDTLSLRKRMQLYSQNYLCYPHDLPENALEDAKAREEGESVSEAEGLTGDGTGEQISEDGVRTNMEKIADEEADATRVEEESEEESEEEAEDESEGDDEESGEAGSEEPAEPVASKKKRRKKKK